LAYGELCRRHSGVAFRTIYRITRNTQDAEDALQNSLMSAFIHLNQFDGTAAFSTWLTRIAINSALMLIRKKRAHPESALEPHGDGETREYEGIPGRSPNPESLLLESERDLHLEQAVRRLPPRLREVVELRSSKDISIKEVAATVGISTSAAKSRLSRAKNELRISLGSMQTRER
jgi:RNA polymerase sigma-70 factor (ECF subfamily)